jgi:hypothetical protein
MQSFLVDVLVFAANLPSLRKVGDAREPILGWVLAKALFVSEICGNGPQKDNRGPRTRQREKKGRCQTVPRDRRALSAPWATL